MELLYRLNANTTIKLESESVLGLVEELTKVRESIGSENCGKCKSSNTYPNSRTIGGDTYYELRCEDCNAVLQLGVNKKEKNLYKKRLEVDGDGKAVKDKNDKAIYLANKGWKKWNPETKKME